MAKRKNSTALFEVITKAQPYPRRERSVQRDSLLARAGNWIKLRLQPTAPTPRSAAAPVAKPAVAPIRAAHALDPILEPVGRAAPAADENVEMDLRAHPEDLSDDDLEPEQSVAVAVDSERRKISLHLSYRAAVVGGVILAVVIGLAILAGQRINRGVPLLAPTTTDKVREGPVHPGVLDPVRRPIVHNDPSPSPAQPGVVKPAPAAPVDGKRYKGLNYVIIQSYHPAEDKMAREAAALLNDAGIFCTVETTVKGYQPITVVGLQGFDRISSPAFKEYIQSILQVSAKLTGNARSYKAFSPVAKKWE